MIFILCSGFFAGCYMETNSVGVYRKYGTFILVWSKVFALAPITIALVFLLDAFRRMFFLKSQQIILSPWKMVLHSFCIFSTCVNAYVLVLSIKLF